MRTLRHLLARLTARERRALAIGLAVIALGVTGRLAPRVGDWLTARRDRADDMTLMLQRGREVIAFEPLARESLGVRAARLLAWAPALFSGGTPAEAGADLSGFVTGHAELSGVRIVRSIIESDSAIAPFVRLVLRVEAEGDIEGLAGWLAQLDAGPRLVAIRELSITALEPAAEIAQAERLRADVRMVAWGAPARSEP